MHEVFIMPSRGVAIFIHPRRATNRVPPRRSGKRDIEDLLTQVNLNSFQR